MAGRTAEDICNLALLYAGVNQRIDDINGDSPTEQACNTAYTENRKNQFSDLRWSFAIKRQQLVPYSGNAYDATVTWAKGALTLFGSNVYRSLQDGNLNHTPTDNASAAWWFQVTRDGYAYVCPLPDDFLDPIAVWEKPTVSAFSTPQVWTFCRGKDGWNLRNPRSSERVPFALENANDGTDNMVLLTDSDTPILKYVADIANTAVYPTEFVEALAWRVAVALATGLRGDEKKADFCEKMANRRAADARIVTLRDQQEDEEPASEFEAARRGA